MLKIDLMYRREEDMRLHAKESIDHTDKMSAFAVEYMNELIASGIDRKI